MIQNWITMYYVYLVVPAHGKFHQTYFVDSCFQQHQKCWTCSLQCQSWSFQRSYSAMSAKLRHGANPPSGLRRHRLLVLLALGAQPEPKVEVVRCQWKFRIFSPCGLISLCVKQQFLQLETEVNCLLWRTHGGRSLKSSYWDAEIWHDCFRCFRLGGIRFNVCQFSEDSRNLHAFWVCWGSNSKNMFGCCFWWCRSVGLDLSVLVWFALSLGGLMTFCIPISWKIKDFKYMASIYSLS